MRALLREQGLEDEIEIDSAGTGGWHAGDPPDARATAAARRRADRARGRRAAGRARATSSDYDLLLAADRENVARPARDRAGRAGAREGAPPARVRPGFARRPRRARPLLRRRRRLRGRARPRRGRLPRAARRAAPAACDRGRGRRGGAAGGSARAARGRRRHQRRAALVELADGRPRVREDARRRARPASTRPRPPALALAGASPAACGCRRCSRSATSFLALEWIDAGALDAAGEEALGRGLARAARRGRARLRRLPRRPRPELRIGPLELRRDAGGRTGPSSTPSGRCAPLIARAASAARCRRAAPRRSRRVCDRIAELAGPAEPPARLHGDLWSGNVLAGARRAAPWLIDPVAYGGHREVDLAMLRLFGAPSPRVLAAYAEAAPLAAGHEERVALWQLFPLLVHAVLFGGGYGALGRGAARRVRGVGLAAWTWGSRDGRRSSPARAAGSARPPPRLLEAEGARVVARLARRRGSTSPTRTRRSGSPSCAGGPVDILVNNAGTSCAKPLDELTDDDWNAPVGAARDGADAADARTSRRGMAERGWGRIVNVASSAGKRPVARRTPAYSVDEGRAALALARVRRHLRGAAACSSTPSRPARSPAGCGWPTGGLADQTAAARGPHARGGDRRAGGQGPARAASRAWRRSPTSSAFLCSERASMVTGAAWSVDGGTVATIV